MLLLRNIIKISIGADLTGKKTTDMWYEEEGRYNYRNAQFSTNTGHFTQIVWAGSTQMGAGRAVSSTGAQFVVARYSPAGNVRGKFEENVRPKGSNAVGGDNQGNFEQLIQYATTKRWRYVVRQQALKHEKKMEQKITQRLKVILG